MHGPQAASVMRNELHYAGYIIGKVHSSLCNHALLNDGRWFGWWSRGDGERLARGHAKVQRWRSGQSVNEAAHESQAHGRIAGVFRQVAEDSGRGTMLFSLLSYSERTVCTCG